VLHTVFPDLLGREVLHIVPGVLPGSIPEPPDLEHESFMFIIPLSDKVVADSLNWFSTRRGKGGDLPRGQFPCPGRITLGRFRGPGGLVPVDSAYTLVTFDCQPTPVCLQDLLGSQSLEDEFPPLVLVRVHEYPISNSEGFASSLYALVEGPFVPGLSLLHGVPD